MEFKLNSNQRLVAFSADVYTRKLSGVRIRKGVIEATNGYLAIQKTIDYDGEEELILKAKEIAKLKKGEIVFTQEAPGEDVKTQREKEIVLQPQQGTFPSIDRVYPEGQPVFKIVIAGKPLEQLLQSLSENEKDRIVFSFYGVNLPVKFEAGYYDPPTAKGLIAPMIIWRTLEEALAPRDD